MVEDENIFLVASHSFSAFSDCLLGVLDSEMLVPAHGHLKDEFCLLKGDIEHSNLLVVAVAT
jgi:hypothetical protein